jgi:hypothetical protein
VTSTRGHGFPSTYKSGCRCASCREANRVYQKAANARRRQDPTGADRAGHGKRSTYINYACRCSDCRSAHTKYLRERRLKECAQ